MTGNGPTWWQTRVVPAPHSSPHTAHDDGSTFFLIFEFFDKNAAKHAILRVAATNGKHSLEGIYSHDQIFSATKFSRSPSEYTSKMRAAIDDVDNNAVTVEADPNASHVCTIRIDLESSSSQVKLQLKHKIDEKTFIERLMTYLAHVETERRLEEENLERGQSERNALKGLVDDAVNKKLDENRKLEMGLRVLMTEKRNHWRK